MKRSTAYGHLIWPQKMERMRVSSRSWETHSCECGHELRQWGCVWPRSKVQSWSACVAICVSAVFLCSGKVNQTGEDRKTSLVTALLSAGTPGAQIVACTLYVQVRVTTCEAWCSIILFSNTDISFGFYKVFKMWAQKTTSQWAVLCSVRWRMFGCWLCFKWRTSFLDVFFSCPSPQSSRSVITEDWQNLQDSSKLHLALLYIFQCITIISGSLNTPWILLWSCFRHLVLAKGYSYY